MQTPRKIAVKVGVLIEHHNKLLLIKEKSRRRRKYYWNIVKGTLEPDRDKNLIEAAKREAREEANARIKITNLLNVLYLYKNQTLYIQFNFIARLIGSRFGISKPADQKKYNEDIIQVKLFTKNELKKMKKKEFINKRAYQCIQDWLDKIKYPVGIIKTIKGY